MIGEKRNIEHREAGGKSEQIEDWMAQEFYLSIHVNGKYMTSFAASPDHCMDLAIGFLFTSGTVHSFAEILKINQQAGDPVVDVQLKAGIPVDIDKVIANRIISSGCGGGLLFNTKVPRPEHRTNTFQIAEDKLHGLMKEISGMAFWYQKTGCVHLASLVFPGNGMLMREDIGRHNAVDKVIGAALLRDYGFGDSILICSGRISSDMCLKAAAAKIPVVISRTAPTTLAVEFADQAGITLIGFLRAKRMNIYSHAQRVANVQKSKWLVG